MKSKLLLYLLFSFSFVFTWGQGRQITGQVTSDSTQQALPGVTVALQNTKTLTTTDRNGRFTITVPSDNAVLVFTSVGFATLEVPVGNQSSFQVRLISTASALDVVVIGYQTVRRRDLLASVSSVSARELKDIPINSAAEALNGRLAGVTATTSEGSPDAAVRIRVRGGMSITQDNSPLYIIDGVQVENGLSTISPQDIQNIDVLKDAAATAIYGARGANGVIVITTKSGRPGRTVVSYNGLVGIKYLPKKLDVLSPYDYVLYQSERSRGSSTDSSTFTKNFGTTWDTLANYKNVPAVDWQDQVFGNTGHMQTHNVNLSGGTRKLTFNFGYTYNEDKAIVINSSYQRHLFNLKGNYKITDNLSVGVTSRYTRQYVFGAGVSSEQGSAYNRLRNAVRYRPFLSANQDLDDADPLADPNVGNGLTLYNPIQLANAENRKKTTDAYNVTGNLSYTFLKHFTFRSTFGYDHNEFMDRQFNDSITPNSIINGGRLPIVNLDTITRNIITNSNVLSYSLKGIAQKHDIDVLVGEETYELRTESRSNIFRNYPAGTGYLDAYAHTDRGVPFTGYPRLGKSKYTNLSFFGRINYAFQDKYLFSFNVRADGASKFAPGRQWGYFPAGSLAWRVKSEKFLKHVDAISDLKFRFGYGSVGNNRINDYLFLTTFRNDGNYYYGLNNLATNAYYPASLVNPFLQWETTINRNLGLDLGLFKGRLNLSVDVYNNSSKDLLLNVPIASTFGYASQLQNIGKTNNRGIEVQLNALVMKGKDNFSWNASFNISSNKNKIEALGTGQTYFYADPSWGVSGQPADYIQRIGDPVGAMWGLVTDGFYTVNDFNYDAATSVYTLKPGVVTNSAIIGVVQPGSIKFKDLNNDGKVDLDNDRTIIGNAQPKFYGGLNQQFTWKRWDASVFVNFSYGNDIYNANKIELTNGYTPNANMLDIMEGRWKVVTATGATAQWVNASNQAVGIAPDQLSALNANATIWQPLRSAGAFYPHSWAIEDGSFLRLNNMTIGYTVPLKSVGSIKITRLRFYLTGNNLAILTNYSGYDPEVSVRNNPLTPGLDYSAYPKSRSFIFGVNASF
ncbi:MAG TPA: TonB-dependent receptor [Flavisolibacter sp.]|jgi:TonB-linked SusC/RagA family outer membrane protein|nr:TonB-dependent receptor [Flavisolibacter sp.]